MKQVLINHNYVAKLLDLPKRRRKRKGAGEKEATKVKRKNTD